MKSKIAVPQNAVFQVSFWSIPLTIVLVSSPSYSFTITPAQPGASRKYDSNENSFSSLFNYSTTLNPTSIAPWVRGGGGYFLDVLNREFQPKGWIFTPSTRSLSGTLEVQYYYACVPQYLPSLGTECGKEILDGSRSIVQTDGFGSSFVIKYTRGVNDPSLNNLHWIQRILVDEAGSTPPYDRIDLAPNYNRSTPYYDAGSAVFTPKSGNSFFFKDAPYRDDPSNLLFAGTTTWLAQLYLVEQTAPKRATIYNGIRWGWTTTVTSRPGSGGGGGGGGGTEPPPGCDGQNYGCTNALSALIASRFTDERGYHVTEPTATASVPEPSSALALLATGVLYGGSRLRKGKVKGSSQRKASPSNFVPKVPSFLLDKYQHSRQQRLSQDASLHGFNLEKAVRTAQPKTEVHKEAQIRTVAGVKLPAYLGTMIDSPMCSLESTQVTQPLALLQSHLHFNDIVLEIGAPNGLISTYCAQQIGSDRVFVYESDAARVEQLQAIYALNDVSPCLKRYCVRGLLNRRTLEQRIKEINPTFLILNEDVEDVWEILRSVELQFVEKLLINLPAVNETAMQEMCEYLAGIGFQVQEEFTLGQEFFFTKVDCLTSEALLSSSTV